MKLSAMCHLSYAGGLDKSFGERDCWFERGRDMMVLWCDEEAIPV